MARTSSTDEEIRELFEKKRKEYDAYDRTLDALAAFSFILKHVEEIANETITHDFRPRIAPHGSDSDPYTPDGVVWQRPVNSLLLELKTSWHKDDVAQIVKYGKSPGCLLPDGTLKRFSEEHGILLGYQNVPGESNLKTLFDEWERAGIPFPLVVFRYSMEVAPEGNRIFFSRVPYARNGMCPATSFGKAMNSPRGYPVSAASFQFVRSSFHRANDQVIDSYAAVLWWTVYAKHYLTEEQKAEMAASGRLSSPLVIQLDRLDQVPTPADVEVPLSVKDVKRALEFLRQAGLVALKKRARAYEVKLKEDRYVRLPFSGAAVGISSPHDISARIITRWAVNRKKHPIAEPQKGRRALRVRTRRRRDVGTLRLPFPEGSSS
jgi:hypothetical protein